MEEGMGEVEMEDMVVEMVVVVVVGLVGGQVSGVVLAWAAWPVRCSVSEAEGLSFCLFV